MNEAEQRQEVIAEAMTWLRTPYHHAARIKGAGVDCLMLLAEVYEGIGLIEKQEIPYYPHDFMFHRSEETYLDGMMRLGYEVETPQPGDVALWKFGRVFSHAAIVIKWPEIIHAYRMEGVVLGRGDTGELGGRPVKFFSLWGGN
jgi:cell wall-associated NlpC family hydrolase